MVTPISLDSADAETIVQLLNQLAAQGYAPDDLRRLHAAYEFAVPLYACHYRSSGRALIDHTVHVTSVVAALAMPPPLLTAALLHAVYLHGDFGTRMKRITPTKRAAVRDAGGDEAEALVYHYNALGWRPATIAALHDRLPSLAPIDRDGLVLRLADQVDIYATNDALYCNNLRHRVAFALDQGPTVAAIAEGLDLANVADVLRRAYDRCAQEWSAAAVVPSRWRDGVYVPRSYRIRPSVAAYQRLRGQLWSILGQ